MAVWGRNGCSKFKECFIYHLGMLCALDATSLSNKAHIATGHEGYCPLVTRLSLPLNVFFSRCLYCNYKRIFRSDLAVHLHTAHDNFKLKHLPPVQCPRCPFSAKMVRAMIRHDCTGNRCPRCPYSSKSATALEQHFEEVHEEEKR